MSTVCILTGSPRVNGSSDAIAQLLAQGLQQEKRQPKILHIRDYRIRPCISCGYCSRHPGTCILDAEDDAGRLFEQLTQADVLLFAIPVYFYGPPAHLKGFIDRAQRYWAVEEDKKRQPRRAHAVFCAARTEGDRLFEANQLILRCFLRALGFSLAEPLLLRGVENPDDLTRNPQYTTSITEMGRAAAKTVVPPHTA